MRALVLALVLLAPLFAAPLAEGVHRVGVGQSKEVGKPCDILVYKDPRPPHGELVAYYLCFVPHAVFPGLP